MVAVCAGSSNSSMTDDYSITPRRGQAGLTGASRPSIEGKYRGQVSRPSIEAKYRGQVSHGIPLANDGKPVPPAGHPTGANPEGCQKCRRREEFSEGLHSACQP